MKMRGSKDAKAWFQKGGMVQKRVGPSERRGRAQGEKGRPLGERREERKEKREERDKHNDDETAEEGNSSDPAW